MKKVFFFSFFTFLTFFSSAQPESSFSQKKTDSNSKWEIGLDLLPLIDSSLSLQNTILIRKLVNEKSKIRVRLGIYSKQTNNRPNEFPETDLIFGNIIKGYLSVGYEKYISLGKVSVYFGGEAFGLYDRNIIKRERDTRTSSNPPEIFKTIDFTQKYTTGINGITGLNVQIINNFFISTEAILQVAYKWEKHYFEQFETEQYIRTVWGGRTIKRYIIDVQPISAIHLIYQF
ncbi:MAG TPA: hypothetical protein VFG10_19235 [Saprospiraceae bacterium]|nr:hypothetical protein [Saprospiraceae bacterium]